MKLFDPFKRFFYRVSSHLNTAFGPDGAVRADAALDQVRELLPMALGVVQRIAVLTPTRTDNEIVALLREYKVDVSIPRGRKLSDRERALLLFAAASVALTNLSPNTVGSVIDAAVQLGYTAWKAGQPPRARATWVTTDGIEFNPNMAEVQDA